MCSIVLRIPIIIINIITLLLGACICGAGFYLRYNPNGLGSILNTYIASALEIEGSASSGAENTAAMISQIATILGPILLGIAYFGIAVMILSLFGLIAASCLIKVLLIIYAILLGILLLGQVIAIIVLATQKQMVIDLVKQQLNAYIPGYQGINGTNVDSFIWNLIMSQAKCCGLDSGADFGGTNMLICCALDGSKKPLDPNCAITQTTTNSFYFTGCYGVLSAEFLNWINIIIICVAVGIGIQAGVFILTVILACIGF